MRRPHRLVYGFILVAGTLLLAASACGGGGSKGSKTPVPTQTPKTVVVTTPNTKATGTIAAETPGTPQPTAKPKTPIPSVTPQPTRTPLGSAEDEAAITAVIDQAMAAVQARDLAGLRALFASTSADTDAEMTTLFVCMANTTRTQEPPSFLFLSDLARATVKFQKTSNGQATNVQGIWAFQKLSGGRWVLYLVPFCPQ